MEKKLLSFWERNATTFKGIIIAILALLLLIPQAMLSSLVNEREKRKEAVTEEVSSKWGSAQNLTGPLLVVPYIDYAYQGSSTTPNKVDNKLTKEIHYAYFLPEQLTINGQIMPEKRNRSIYEIIVYSSTISFKGKFNKLQLTTMSVPAENWLLKEAFIAVGISDLRGIEEQIKLHWNNQAIDFRPGLPTNGVLTSGVHAIVPTQLLDAESVFDFSLVLKGSKQLFFTPIGKETIVSLKSTWPNPSFDGAVLPDTRTVTNKGFEAMWKVLDINRNFPQQWIDHQENLAGSQFGVNLIAQNDGYQQTMRSIKYGIMLVALTFMVFFFIELLNPPKVHPFQYLLIGLALCIFYTLLLSISEYIKFWQAYIIATILTLGLIVLYAKSIFQNLRLTGLIGGTLVLMYGFVFIVIQLEDTALLVGSIGLFLVLAAVMYFSRKVDWYNIRSNE